MTPEEMEQLLRKDAAELVKTEPLSKLMLEEQILNRKNFADMLGVTLACQLAGEVIDRPVVGKFKGIGSLLAPRYEQSRQKEYPHAPSDYGINIFHWPSVFRGKNSEKNIYGHTFILF